MKLTKQAYTVEFKERAVKRVKDEQSIGSVAQERRLSAQTLRHW
jgi:transposase-like protein